MKRQGRAVEAEMLKLVMNAIYGKLIQNVEGFKNSQLYTEVGKFVKAVNGRRMKDFDVIFGDEEFSSASCTASAILCSRSPWCRQAGAFCASAGCRCSENHYEGIKPIFPTSKVTFTDTDSAHYWIFADEDPLHTLARANEEPGRWPCFATSPRTSSASPAPSDTVLAHLTPEQRRIAAERAGELGGFGVEHLPRRVYEEIQPARQALHRALPRRQGRAEVQGHHGARQAQARGVQGRHGDRARGSRGLLAAAESQLRHGHHQLQEEGPQPAERQGLPDQSAREQAPWPLAQPRDPREGSASSSASRAWSSTES